MYYTHMYTQRKGLLFFYSMMYKPLYMADENL